MPRGMWGLFAVWEPNGAYNTVDTNVGAYNTIYVRVVRSTIPAGVQGMVLVSWFDFVRCLLRSPLVPSE